MSVSARAAAARRRGPSGHPLYGHGACEQRQAPRPPAGVGNGRTLPERVPKHTDKVDRTVIDDPDASVVSDPFIARVFERDVDLLILEDLYCDINFRAWFCGRIEGLPLDGGRFVHARHCVRDPGTGESDIEAYFEIPARGRVVLLIENKISAPFQDNQPERYRERIAGYVARGEYVDGWSVLLAPQSYIQGAGETATPFIARVPYEDIREWYLSNGSNRQQYRARVLELAIANARRASAFIEDPALTEFHRRYWDLHREYAPQLGVPEPKPKGAGATWVYLHPKDLPKNTDFVHQVPEGRVMLAFQGRANDLPELKARIGGYFKSGDVWETTKHQARVWRPVKRVDPRGDFEAQCNDLIDGLRTAAEMLTSLRRGLQEWE